MCNTVNDPPSDLFGRGPGKPLSCFGGLVLDRLLVEIWQQVPGP